MGFAYPARTTVALVPDVVEGLALWPKCSTVESIWNVVWNHVVDFFRGGVNIWILKRSDKTFQIFWRCIFREVSSGGPGFLVGVDGFYEFVGEVKGFCLAIESKNCEGDYLHGFHLAGLV